MTRDDRLSGVSKAISEKPLQAGKSAGILLVLGLGVGGLMRVFDATAVVDDPLLGDGQFLALLLLPLVGLGLVLLVFVETLVDSYRIVKSEERFRELVTDRLGYTTVRGAEAVVAVVGVAVMSTALPTLFAESTPAPAGVGIMLLLGAVGLGILVASFVRATVELVLYTGTA